MKRKSKTVLTVEWAMMKIKRISNMMRIVGNLHAVELSALLLSYPSLCFQPKALVKNGIFLRMILRVIFLIIFARFNLLVKKL